MASSSSFIDRNDYLSRLMRLPTPGANSRLMHQNANQQQQQNHQQQDAYAITKQWQTALAASECLFSSSSHHLHPRLQQQNHERRIVQLKLCILPTAPITTLDISLPPVLTGGQVDLFWPSETSVVDEATLELPRVPPIKFNNTTNKNNNQNIDALIQQQWIPTIHNALKSNVMKLHRFIALRPGGIKNKRWEFEASSYLSSLPEEEWDVQVEKSSVFTAANSNNMMMMNPSSFSPSTTSTTTASTTTRGIMSAIEGYMFGGSSSNSSFSSMMMNGNNSSSIPTMAIHLRIKLFSAQRSEENRRRLLRAISTIMKHSMEQLKGGEVRDQLDALESVRSNSAFLAAEKNKSDDLFRTNSNSNNNNRQNDDDNHNKTEISNEKINKNDNLMTGCNSSQFDVTSDLSFVIHVSESISNEYQFAALQDQRVVFDITDRVLIHQNEESAKIDAARRIAFAMLKQRLFDELFPVSVSQSPLPVANKDDFSFYDFVPGVEETILAAAERLANWCHVLYGFTVTFGSPMWDRSELRSVTTTSLFLLDIPRPPCFSNSAAFMFETPRTDHSSPVISLFIQLSARTHNPHRIDDAQHHQALQSNQGESRSSHISPIVNILSAQLERNGQPVMFSWNNNNNINNNIPSSGNSDSYYESIAGSVLQYLVDSVPKLQGLYRSLLLQHHQQHGQHSASTSNPSSTPPASMSRFNS